MMRGNSQQRSGAKCHNHWRRRNFSGSENCARFFVFLPQNPIRHSATNYSRGIIITTITIRSLLPSFVRSFLVVPSADVPRHAATNHQKPQKGRRLNRRLPSRPLFPPNIFAFFT